MNNLNFEIKKFVSTVLTRLCFIRTASFFNIQLKESGSLKAVLRHTILKIPMFDYLKAIILAKIACEPVFKHTLFGNIFVLLRKSKILIFLSSAELKVPKKHIGQWMKTYKEISLLIFWYCMWTLTHSISWRLKSSQNAWDTFP